MPGTAIKLQASATKLKNGATALITQGTVIQAYFAAIQAQPDIEVNSAPGLPGLQEEARKNVTVWNEKVWGKCQESLASIIAYGSTYKSFSPTLQTYAQQAMSPNAADAKLAKSNLYNGLNILYNQVSGFQKSADTALESLQSWESDAIGINKQLDGALAALRTKYTGKDGVLEGIDSTIHTISSGMDSDIVAITFGVVGIVAGIVTVYVGACTEMFDAGTSTPIIIGGTATIIAGFGGMVGGSVDYANKARELKKLTTEKATEESNYAAIKIAMSQISALDQKSNAAVSAGQSLCSTWSDLKDDLGKMRDDVNGISAGDNKTLMLLKNADKDMDLMFSTAQEVQVAMSGGRPLVTTGGDPTQPGFKKP